MSLRCFPLLLLAACQPGTDSVGKDDTGADTSDSGSPDSADSSDTNESGDTGDTDPGDSGDSGDTSGDTGNIYACPDQVFAADTIIIDGSCSSGSSSPNWEFDLALTLRDGTQSGTPVVGELTDDDGDGLIDADDVPDVVLVTAEGVINVHDGASGRLLWSVETGLAGAGTAALGDVDGDGVADVVIAGASVGAWRGSDGAELWTAESDRWANVAGGAVSIADMNGDGAAEVIFGNVVLAGRSGVSVTTGPRGFYGTGMVGVAPASTVADLDVDGQQEVLVGAAAFSFDGTTLWANPTVGDGYTAVLNADADASAEIVVSNEAGVSLLDSDGTLLWTVVFAAPAYGPPAVADIDGDGTPEILVGVRTGLLALRLDGTLDWAYTSDSGDTFDGVSAYDLDGDGAWEVLDQAAEHLNVIDGRTGVVLASYPHDRISTIGAYPIVVDLDQDEHADILYNLDDQGVIALSDVDREFASARPIWNQFAYSITNVNDDGSIPAAPEPSWVTYGSFRAGAPGHAGALLPDLVPIIDDVCVDDCKWGHVRAWISLSNTGPVAVTRDVAVTLYGVIDVGAVALWTGPWTEDLVAGERTESMVLDLYDVPRPLLGLVLAVDGGLGRGPNAVEECDEDDNEADWVKPVCP